MKSTLCTGSSSTEQVRGAEQRAGDQHALELAAGQRLHGAIVEMGDAGLRQRPVDPAAGAARRTSVISRPTVSGMVRSTASRCGT
ncbi:MAG: hypothetical protein M5U33_03970 [Pseudorhodoplanes sp.]|nr:hypothetical protein [Pseudorhodoplanes sp.]